VTLAGGSSTPSSSADAPASSSAADAPAFASAPIPYAPPGRAATVLAATKDHGLALVAAKTTTTLQIVDAHTFVIRAAFPNKATAEVTYHLFRRDGTGAAPKTVVTGKDLGDHYQYHYEYVVPATSLPADLRGQLSALPTIAPAAFDGGDHTPTGSSMQLVDYVADNPPGTIDVVVDGTVSQTIDIAKGDLSKVIGGATGEQTVSMLDLGKKLWEAFQAASEIKDALDEQSALTDCAENPTNPLTIDQYAKDPTARQKILDQLEAATGDIKGSAVALGVASATDMGSGELGGLPAGPLAAFGLMLGYLVSIGTNAVKANVQAVIDFATKSSKAAVTPCHTTYTVSGGAGPVRISGVVTDLSAPYVLNVSSPGASGTVRVLPSSETDGELEGRSQLAGGLEEVTKGTYHLTKTAIGYSGTGTVKTCLTVSCSAMGTFHLTYIEKKSK